MWQALIKLVEKWACRHEWERKEAWIEVESNKYGYRNHDVTLYVCKKCGKFKKV